MHMRKQKVLHPLIRKLIYLIGIIWFLVIVVVALVEPDLSNWGYLIVGAPLIVLSLFAGYVIRWATISSIIDWLAVTSDREEIKNAIRNFIIILIIILIINRIFK